MKTRKMQKKLALNKISIVRLDKDMLNEVKGGLDETIIIEGSATCLTNYPYRCPYEVSNFSICPVNEGHI